MVHKAPLERIRCPCSSFPSHSADVHRMIGVKLHNHFQSGLAHGLSRGGVSSACRLRLSGAFAVTQSDSVRWPATLAKVMSRRIHRSWLWSPERSARAG